MKIKTVLFLIFGIIFTASHSFAQLLNGYKYIAIQSLKYQNGNSDVWNIANSLRTSFADLGIIVLPEFGDMPKDLENDPCLMIRCFISHTNVTSGTNEVTISLKNCKNEVIFSNKGGAMGWSLQDDFNKATRRAFSPLLDLEYNFNSSLTPEIDFPEVEKTIETEETIKAYLLKSKIDPIEGIYKSYQSEGLSSYKFGIIKKDGKYKAIILESELKHWKVGEVKAIFEPSSMKDIYSVDWYLADKTKINTFGNMESWGLLLIEFPEPKLNNKKIDKFVKMFPIQNKESQNESKLEKASGSGFFLTVNGIIATNSHVIENAERIEITFTNELGTHTYKTKLLLNDTKNDVALLQIDDLKFKGLTTIPFGISENSEVGSKAFTIGYPLNDIMGNNFKVTDGIISSKSGIGDDIRYYQISVPLQPGNSGGPLFNKDGNVIGITTARLNSQAAGTKIENVNYAIKSSYLINLYNMLPNSKNLPTNRIVTKELSEQVKILKNYVCLIRVF